LKVYLDASVLVALFTRDRLSARADSYLRANLPVLIVSNFAAAEFSSALARRVRTGEMTPDEARIAFSNFDAWTARSTQHAEVAAADVTTAQAFLRRLDLTLRTPDAINIAIAVRVGADLATFDDKMAASARALGTPVAAA
jgi:predicted nucleic acid-binding protein